ncbi:MAG TPA: NAD(P)/FAD-dependent oxidoreductase [Aquabacterium sp.]|uniref:NAD(P)/FAD-dependent oxidoreductase n=1 Tax=Aquabacterium sp. TaxID=1872578 RepID=UPI002E380E75|nr:NAD(P)/FAD-dependent oxidoreductase [Aquabacterium sp.]HEX5371493.1 NAD(P)/FAD-dependent oxidoreductase [Aquabacterium sp.]
MLYDVIVVGARCAGSAIAMLLARQGHRVLMIDQGSFPSDVRTSTHLVWHAGVDRLARWGLLDTLQQRGCYLLRELSLDLGDAVIQGHAAGAEVGAAMAPRRIVLDQVLLEAALAAGAHLRECTSFESVIEQNGRVVGIRVRDAEGQVSELSCRLLIGADGRTSPVARAVGARVYNEFSKTQGAYNTYAYFTGVKTHDIEFFGRPERMIYTWPTNTSGQVLVGILQPGGAPRVDREHIETRFFEELDALVPELATRLRQGQRVEDWLGVSINTQCRQASGPGWCLLGDAGITIDPFTAGGITNALRDAEALSVRLHCGLSGQADLDEALAGFEEERNAVSLPLFHFAQQAAELALPSEDIMKMFEALIGNQAQIDRYFGVYAQTVPIDDFFGPENQKTLLAEHAARATQAASAVTAD